MKKSSSSLFAGLVLPSTCLMAMVVLGACSGTPADQSNPDMISQNGDGGTTEVPATPLPGQNQNPDIQDQERSALVANAKKKAEHALEIGNWALALDHADYALGLAPNDKEARDLYDRARRLLGEHPDSVERRTLDIATQLRVEQEQDRARAINELTLGDASSLENRYDAAIEHYSRAQTILHYSPYNSPGSDLNRRTNEKLAQARQAQQEWQQEQAKNRELQANADLQKQARMQAYQKEARIKSLLEDANLLFQEGRYTSAVQALKQVQLEDPFNGQAAALLELADRASHDQYMTQARAKWSDAWQQTFDEIEMMDLPQTDVIVYDYDRWREVRERKPLTFKSPEELQSPEDVAILDKLKNTEQAHTFANASIEDWSTYYSGITGVNFSMHPSLEDLDEDSTTLEDFRLPPRSVFQALNVISDVTGVHWRINNGMVQLVTKEFSGGKLYLSKYDVRDIVEGVPDRPAPEMKLQIGLEDEEFPEEDDPTPTIVDVGALTDLVRANIDPDSWDVEGASISDARGVLLVRQTKTVHQKVEQLLNDLRQAVGIQVDVEARFLKVEDNFLEDIGVDFRGLGNDSSEGIPGRGIANRPTVGFDDFGPPQQINPASPGEIGTGTEPGIFFDDGGDGDIMARTEQLYDSSLGGNNGLENGGGLALQYAFLDDAEVEAILRAVSKKDRSEEITAPRLLIYNNSRSSMQVVRETSYLKDFNVEIAQAAAVATPVVGVVKDGVVLDVRPVVSADRKFITMELRPTVMTLTLPMQTFTTTLGVGQPVSIQLPETQLQRVRTMVTVPDGGTILLGGMRISEKQQLESGIPVLSQIPVLSFFFSRKGTTISSQRLLILIRARVVIPGEDEPVLPPDDFEAINSLAGSR